MSRLFKSRSFLVAGMVALSCVSAAAAHAGSNANVIEAAKSEGKMSYYTTMTLSQSKKVVDAFQKKYPFITPELFRGGGDEVLNRIQNEARGGLYAWDVVSTRGDSVLTFEESKLIAPYRSPESKFIDKDMVDDDGYWAAYYVNPYVLGYNTKLVKKEEVPKTYEQLLDPKWKGRKISIDDSAYGLLAGLTRACGKEKAVEYFKKLAAQEPVVQRGNTNRVQLTMAGEFPLIIAYAPTIQRETSKQHPIDWVPLEPVPVQVNPMMLASKAPHPNAGKLFIDFLLSKEGQKMPSASGEFQCVKTSIQIRHDSSKVTSALSSIRKITRISIRRSGSIKKFSASVKMRLVTTM